MPFKDPEKRRAADKARYDAKREEILEQKRTRQKDPDFQGKRKAYLAREDVKGRRRRREAARYASDPDYREAKVIRAAKRRETPEGRAKNARQAKEWRDNNPGRAAEGVRRWIAANPARVREYYRLYKQHKFATDPAFKVAEHMRCRVRQALKARATTKDTTTMKLVGCSVAELVSHLEQQFLPGMSWENYGEWHVDHIRELCSFDLTNPSEQAMAFHFTNLRPLWAADNLSRPNKHTPSDNTRPTRAKQSPHT